MGITLRRSLAAAAVLALGTLTTACTTAENTTDRPDQVTDSAAEGGDVKSDSLVGLEVTFVGNVEETLSGEAIVVDRDGLGQEQGGEQVLKSDYGYYDYDYYDYDGLTAFDEEFGDEDLGREGVLVVSNLGLENFSANDAVRVSGTIRKYDKDVIERTYRVDLEDNLFNRYEDWLVILATSVKPASEGGSGGQAPGATASASARATDAATRPGEPTPTNSPS